MLGVRERSVEFHSEPWAERSPSRFNTVEYTVYFWR